MLLSDAASSHSAHSWMAGGATGSVGHLSFGVDTSGCFQTLGVLSVGVLRIRAPLFLGLYRGHWFLETPKSALQDEALENTPRDFLGPWLLAPRLKVV